MYQRLRVSMRGMCVCVCVGRITLSALQFGKTVWGLTSAVEHLPSMWDALSSISSTI